MCININTTKRQKEVQERLSGSGINYIPFPASDYSLGMFSPNNFDQNKTYSTKHWTKVVKKKCKDKTIISAF